MREHFGVRDRGEDVSSGFELFLEFGVVLDDAVVDDRNIARAVEVRVGVHGFGRAVGRPTGVANARTETLGGIRTLFA